MANQTTEEERLWCSHCGVHSPLRLRGTVKACEWCGKVLADETGTAEAYSLLFRLRLQGIVKRKRRTITSQLSD